MEDSNSPIAMNNVAPMLGTVIGIAMWLSPLKTVLQARKEKYLGSLNPYPFGEFKAEWLLEHIWSDLIELSLLRAGITVLNCYAWMLYAAMIKDYYIFASNFPGFVLGLFYSISSLVLLSQGKSSSEGTTYFWLESILIYGAVYFGLVSMYVGISLDDTQTDFGRSIVAYSGIACAISYYAAPCTTIVHIIRTRSASSLHPPMLLANAANASLWLIYGYFTLNDAFVYGPNLIGLLLTAFQLCLVCIYGGGLPL